MKVTNPHDDRAILATIATVQNDRDTLTSYEIPAGESIEVADYAVAATLVEYGAVAAPEDLRAARVLWAERNRLTNSATASASASEGEILARRQATVDVALGTTDPGSTGGPVLRGAELAAAVRAANAAGAGIPSGLTADENREALARWQATQGSSTPVEAGGQYVTTQDGELYLDDDGNPVEIADVLVDAQGHAVFGENGRPVQRQDDALDLSPAQPTDVTPPPA